MSEIENLIKTLKTFAEQREWQPFHSPKNVSMALAAEAGELLEHFQWLTQEQSRNLDSDTLAEVTDEVADVFIYTLRMADELGIDLVQAAQQKIIKNGKKYPVDKAKGRATKYSKL